MADSLPLSHSHSDPALHRPHSFAPTIVITVISSHLLSDDRFLLLRTLPLHFLFQKCDPLTAIDALHAATVAEHIHTRNGCRNDANQHHTWNAQPTEGLPLHTTMTMKMAHRRCQQDDEDGR